MVIKIPVILFTSKNIASKNIANQLIALGYDQGVNDTWGKNGVKLIDTQADSILDVPTNFETDYIIVLSSHKSKHEQNSLTAHFPGNWNKADFGGNDRTLNIAYASKLKRILTNMKKINERDNGKWDVTLEVDHHGPTCSIPIIFVELGSMEKQWSDIHGAKIVAEAVEKSLKDNRKYETIFGVGSGHYPKEFNKMELETDLAIGHLLPKFHLDSLAEDTFKQAIEKNIEKINKVYVLKNHVNTKQKIKLKDLCSSFSVEYIEV